MSVKYLRHPIELQFLQRPRDADRHTDTCAAMVAARTLGDEYYGSVPCDCGFDDRWEKERAG